MRTQSGRFTAIWPFGILGKSLGRAVLILLGVVLAQAATIVDTGPGVSSGPADGSCLCYDQWLAAEFTLDRPMTITQVEGWIQGLNGVTIQIRTMAFDRPGQVVLHETRYSGAYSDPYRWFGPSGLDWDLRPGTYWVVFGVQGSDGNGGMAKKSPRPLGREAYSSGPGGSWSVSNDMNFGIRIFGEPSAPTVSFENTQTIIHSTNSMAELRIVADPGRTAPVVVTIRRLAGLDLPEASFPVIIQPYQNLVSIPHGPLTRSTDFTLESTEIKVAAPSRVTAVYPPPRIWLCCESVEVSATGSFATFLHTDVLVRTNLVVYGNLLDSSNRVIQAVGFNLGDGAGPVIPISWTNLNLVRGGRLMLTSVTGQNGASVMTNRLATLKGPPLISIGLCCPEIQPNREGIITARIQAGAPLPSEAVVGGDLQDSQGNFLARLQWRIPQGAMESVIAHTNRALLGGGRITLVNIASEPRVILGGRTNALATAVILPYVEPTTVSFSAPRYEFPDNGVGMVMAILSRPLPQVANVRVKLIGGSSNAFSGLFTFPPGAVTAQLQLELAEPATLQLETGNLLPGDHPAADITMPPPRVTLGPIPTLAEKGRSVTFQLFATRPGVDRTIEFNTRDLTAAAGRDYIPTNGTLSFTNRAAFISIQVPTNAVGGLSFQLVLTNARNANFPATNLTVAILSAPRFAQPVYFADANGDARVQLQVDNPMPFPVPFTMNVARDNFSTQFGFEFPAGRTNEELKLPLGAASRHVHELTLSSASGNQQSALVMPFGSTTNASEIVVRAIPILAGNVAAIAFERRGNLSKPMFFSWATEDGTARAGIDYRAGQNAVFFNRGDRYATIEIETFQSDASERRVFSVVVSEVSDPEAFFTDVKMEVTIVPDMGNVEFFSERFTVESVEATEISFYHTSGIPGNYEYFTSDGSARAGFDYVQTRGTLTNVADGSIRVPLIDDTVVEPAKYFTFYLIQTAPARSTNAIKVYIGDNELASARDLSFQIDPASESDRSEYWAVLPDDRIVNLRRNRDIRIFSKDGALMASRDLELLKDIDWSLASIGPDGSVGIASWAGPIYRISTDTLREEKVDIEGSFTPVLAAAFLPGGSMMIARARLLEDRWELVRLHLNGRLDASYPVFSASILPGERINRMHVRLDGSVKIGFQLCLDPWGGCFDSSEILIQRGELIRTTERPASPERNRWLLPDGGSLVQLYNPITGTSELIRHRADGTLEPDFASSFLDGDNKTYIGSQSDGSVIVWSSSASGDELLRLKSSPALQENVLISGVGHPSTLYEGQTTGLVVYRTGNSASSLPFRIDATNSKGEPSARIQSLDRIFQIPAGQSSLSIGLTPIDDNIAKPPETLILSLEPLAAGVPSVGAEVPVLVHDNDRGVGLSVSGLPFAVTFNQFAAGTTYDIEASDDLVTWTLLGTRTGTSQWQESPNRRSRFFRARLK